MGRTIEPKARNNRMSVEMTMIAIIAGSHLAIAASVAKLACSEALLQVALDTMRIHGGIGFTWEHDAHLFVRRAKATQLSFGTPDYHAERLAMLVPEMKGPL